MTFKIVVETIVNSTEDEKKVLMALKNIVQGSYKIELRRGRKYLKVEVSDVKSLEPLYRRLREQMILETARMILLKNLKDNKLIFYLNKQAAYMNNINFCEDEDESPLGPIIVEIEGDKIRELIDWLTPHTVDGKPIETKNLRDLI